MPPMTMNVPVGLEFAFGKKWSILLTFQIAINGAIKQVAGIWDANAPSFFSGWSGEWSFSPVYPGKIHVYIDSCKCNWKFHTDMFVDSSCGRARYLRNWMPMIMDGEVREQPQPWSIETLIIKDVSPASTLDSSEPDGFSKV